MNERLAVTIIGIFTLAINYSILLLVFPRRFNKLLSFILPVLYTAVFYSVLLATGNMTEVFGGFRGFVHLPLIFLLIKGQVFQKFFFILMQMLNVGFLLATVKTAIIIFVEYDSEAYYSLYIIISFVLYLFYILAILKFGKKLVSKILINGQSAEWAVYSLGAFFSFSVFAVTFETVENIWLYILLMVSSLWSFIILCFAIIRTHEKTKQRYEADFARNIIISGREYYEKMNEIYDNIRILRHDYKYHLCTVRELLRSGKSDEIDSYLDSVESCLNEKVFPFFCKNNVINALLSDYASRCDKLCIDFTAEITLPENINIPNYEICIVLGNLLENAIEACYRRESEKRMSVFVKPQGTQLAVKVSNTYAGTICVDGNRFESTKANGGLGLRSVNAVTSRYDGELITEWDDCEFTAYALLGR